MIDLLALGQRTPAISITIKFIQLGAIGSTAGHTARSANGLGQQPQVAAFSAPYAILRMKSHPKLFEHIRQLLG